ncbi:hypothetical protein [Stygiolobus caldivivus]|uniref:Uncharacterized protein n=1 Tax=Stygiolobus caldivivus TaxID=2824673 RepID=A0A8D5U844_9CREN|nr:hypothetical protein [Stygiolobus caldivivus]BCU71119.1 hypothetical protein KN1_24160 [Stygiolobus caldivivus]
MKGLLAGNVFIVLPDDLETENGEVKCVINTLKEWSGKRYINMVANHYTVQNMTIRPAVISPFSLLNKGVSKGDLFGHGVLIRTKDGHLVFIGRVDPNWTGVVVARGEFWKAKYLGVMDFKPFGVIDFGNIVKDWVNPASSKVVSYVQIPLYTGNLLLSKLKKIPTKPIVVASHLTFRTSDPPFMYGSIIKDGLVINTDFIIEDMEHFPANCPPLDILKVGIGAPIQGGCGYGNAGLIVDIVDNHYVGVPTPDLSSMTTGEIAEYFKDVLGVDFSPIFEFGDVLTEVYEKYSKYGFGDFVYRWLPIGKKGEAERIFNIGKKIYERAKEMANNEYLDKCFLEYADPYSNIDKEARIVYCCTRWGYGSLV